MEINVSGILPEEKIVEILPRDDGFKIEALYIGTKKSHYTSTAPVTGNNGYVSGGGTRGLLFNVSFWIWR